MEILKSTLIVLMIFILPLHSTFADTAVNGSIGGVINFPGEKIPKDIKICALEITTNQEICTTNKVPFGRLYKYELTVPVGTYNVYAVSNDPNIGESRGYRAFYTELVICGLKATCSSHRKIDVTVKAASKLKNINPQDWYAPAH